MSLGEAFSKLIERMVVEEFHPKSVKVIAEPSPFGGTYYIEMTLDELPEDVEFRITEIVNEVEFSFYMPTSFDVEKDGDSYKVRALFVSSGEEGAYAYL
ncbi:hypothetical protein [Ignicoccus hospitalis]|uniref:Uncharacterized protein n=1 Tax=Ignicoccus hospitalis (strain KIN4/I / DSM 18386 / JCM 14125) TaxID=453591 RepID=A8A980_IGNH4|nr:hypothetical protein [Ignicoccus hospitalis]ABU81482.1 hypothetical protein Igni_0299 [Ignicoccus hospitalis KIN4/I]HIH90210.1 hypothetical protein [Desulfurococcaceae archaeon]